MTDEHAEADPILRFQSGDRRAFNELVSSYSTSLRVFFYRNFWDRSLADDLAQEVFVKIFRGIGNYRSQGCHETYIWRVARNVLIDHLRSVRARPKLASIDCDDQRERGLEERVSDSSPEGGPLDTLQRLEAMDRLRDALESLTSELRETFELGVLEGMKYAEIAELLEIPVGTVKSRIFNAVRALRKRLPDLGGDVGASAAAGPFRDGARSPAGSCAGEEPRRGSRSKGIKGLWSKWWLKEREGGDAGRGARRAGKASSQGG